MTKRMCRMPWLALLALLGVWGLGGLDAELQAADFNVPNWQLPCADGELVDFHQELTQRPVIVSFWALWCKPCLKELAHLDELAQEYADELLVLAVNIDSQRSVAKVRPFLKSKGYRFRVPLDTAGDLQRQMQVGDRPPYLVLYDTTGREAYSHLGYKEGDEITLRQEIEKLLGKKDQQAAGGEE